MSGEKLVGQLLGVLVVVRHEIARNRAHGGDAKGLRLVRLEISEGSLFRQRRLAEQFAGQSGLAETVFDFSVAEQLLALPVVFEPGHRVFNLAMQSVFGLDPVVALKPGPHGRPRQTMRQVATKGQVAQNHVLAPTRAPVLMAPEM